MGRQRNSDEDEARQSLATVRSPRSAWAAWARAQGVGGVSVNARRVNLESRAPRWRGVAPKLVELVPAPTAGAMRQSYVLHVGGVELEIGDDFDDQALRRLVGVLKSC